MKVKILIIFLSEGQSIDNIFVQLIFLSTLLLPFSTSTYFSEF